jgi:Mg-chelatase subunit ChlD
LVAAIALLGAFLAGCGSFGPTLPSPDPGTPPSGGSTTFELRDPADPNTPISGATANQFTVCEDESTDAAANGETCGLRITRLEELISGGDNADVVVVLDRSGSMSAEVSSGRSRLEAAKDAAKLLVSLMKPADRVELIAFDSTVTVAQPFTSDQAALNAAIDAIDLGGTTAVWAAGRQAVADLVASGRPAPVAHAVILLTDGVDNSSPPDPVAARAGLISEATAAGVPVYTIGLGDGTDEAALQEVADQTGGQFSVTEDEDELRQIFQAIFESVTQGGDYRIWWDSNFPPGTVVHVTIYYKKGTPDEIIVFDGNVTVTS